ncbi:MAG: phosphodiester glycosidase family protein [Verrucomicrobia bacterium]|nr:MAG: phosphodiester glycosidase family protein [Verrucomicrobiota bacterium]
MNFRRPKADRLVPFVSPSSGRGVKANLLQLIRLSGCLAGCLTGMAASAAPPIAGASYTNVIVASEPWSIHIAKLPRTGAFEIHSRHAGNRALGLSTLSEQAAADTESGQPVAAINGGFYRRDKTYAGAARGLQIVDGEILSAPNGAPCLWLDLNGEPHLESVASQFQLTWPDGSRTPCGLNEDRAENAAVLYTPAIGTSTRTTNGMEFVLEQNGSGRWLPLRCGRNLPAKVRSIQTSGNSTLTPETMVLSVGPKLSAQFQTVKAGDVLQISTATTPSLSLARNALSAGPVLLRAGKRQKIIASPDDAYESSSMLERHPRSAIAWNAEWFFLVVVDGRQRDVSDGMTLDELSNFLAKLGCEDALNLDGGGSSALWFDGNVRNTPCDGYERAIANSLVVVKKMRK